MYRAQLCSARAELSLHKIFLNLPKPFFWGSRAILFPLSKRIRGNDAKAYCRLARQLYDFGDLSELLTQDIYRENFEHLNQAVVLSKEVAEFRRKLREHPKHIDQDQDSRWSELKQRGDIGYIAEDGYIYLVERFKNLIIVSGFNVYPSEIEDILCEHPNIAEAACIGVADEHSGQKVKAFVVERKHGQLSEADVIAHCKEYLTGYKIPSQVEFRDSLPKSNAGKILHCKL